MPPAPVSNPWQKPTTISDMVTQSGSGEQTSTEVMKEEHTSAGKGSGKSVTIANDLPKKVAVAPANKNPWGSPLKSYSWADEEPIDTAPKVEETKENKRKSQGNQPRSNGEGKETKGAKSAHNQPRDDMGTGEARTGDTKEHPLRSKFSKSAEKLAKIAHIMPVKVSPPPKTKFTVRCAFFRFVCLTVSGGGSHRP